MKILSYPNEKLTLKTKDVKKVDSRIRAQIAKMRQTLTQVKGVGLASPQIGQSYKLAVIGFKPTEEQLKKNPKLKRVPEMVLINPIVISHSKQIISEKEGCLSHPKAEFTVPRYKKIHVEYLDETGQRKKIKARGYLARVIQHEIDHLNGKTIINYLH